MTFTTGARQLVVHDAAVTMSCSSAIKLIVHAHYQFNRHPNGRSNNHLLNAVLGIRISKAHTFETYQSIRQQCPYSLFSAIAGFEASLN